jgi:catechol 2,3-dioxygenase-like lactoylglutathione lyase family enzyme
MNTGMNEITHIGYVTLWCADLAETRDVMNRSLGLPIAFEDSTVVVFAVQGTQLILRVAVGENEFRAGTMEMGFYLDALQPITDTLKTNTPNLLIENRLVEGAQPVASVRMPGGQYIELVQRAKPSE